MAEQLTLAGPLEAHARDEIGLSETLAARPHQAAVTSGASFIAGSLIPLATVLLTPPQHQTATIAPTGLAGLGGATWWKSSLRVVFWGSLAMALTSAVGKALGVEA